MMARLPSQIEWERAAKGKSGHDKYPTSDPGTVKKGERKLAHYGFLDTLTTDVCSYGLNSFGLCDLAGNVEEWTSDWEDDAYVPAHGRRRKIYRGGSWSFEYFHAIVELFPGGFRQIPNRDPLLAADAGQSSVTSLPSKTRRRWSLSSRPSFFSNGNRFFKSQFVKNPLVKRHALFGGFSFQFAMEFFW